MTQSKQIGNPDVTRLKRQARMCSIVSHRSSEPESSNEEFIVGIRSFVASCALFTVSGLVALPTNAALPRANAGPPLSQRTATALYAKNCASCHGKDGRSRTFKAKFNKARNLTEHGWQEAVSDERIYNSIANGRGSKMPAFTKKMSEAEIDALVLLVRGLRKS